MKSFGIWYKFKESAKIGTDEPEISLHVNLWSLENIEIKESKKPIDDPFLDIGLKIENFNQLENVTFHCPFAIGESNILDLSDKLSSKKNAVIIFNTDCEIETKDSYTIINLNKGQKNEESILIFPLKQSFPEIFTVKKLEEFEKTNITFDFTNFLKYIQAVQGLNSVQNIYIRFRIESKNLKDSLYFDSELLNRSFESAFSGTRIIDFKINEKRNIDEKIKVDMLINGHKWANLGKVHLLVMEPSSYDLISFSEANMTMTCRELEAQIWDDYLDAKIDFNKSHVLVYHWRGNEKKTEQSFSCLVKIKYSHTMKKKIYSYIFIIVGLGILGSAIVNFISSVLNKHTIWALVTSIVLVAVLVWIGKVLNDNKNGSES